MNTEVPAPEPLIRRFMPELDVLRGIAVLGVVFFHGFRAEYGDLPFTGAPRMFVQATQPGAVALPDRCGIGAGAVIADAQDERAVGAGSADRQLRRLHARRRRMAELLSTCSIELTPASSGGMRLCGPQKLPDGQAARSRRLYSW